MINKEEQPKKMALNKEIHKRADAFPRDRAQDRCHADA